MQWINSDFEGSVERKYIVKLSDRDGINIISVNGSNKSEYINVSADNHTLFFNCLSSFSYPLLHLNVNTD